MIKTTIAAALLSLTTLAAVPAHASGLSVEVGVGPGWSDNGHGWDVDYRRDHHRRYGTSGSNMSPDQIRQVLRWSGFRDAQFLDDSGEVERVVARRDGATYLLIVNPRNARILSQQRM